jgi:hypothetical protein
VKRAIPAHGIIPLFDATMILLQRIVEIVVTLMEHVTSKDLANGTWIGAVPIRDDEFWSTTNYFKCLLEKLLCSIHIAFLAYHRVNQVSITINGTIERAPVPVHFDVRFIDMPGGSCLSMSLFPSLVCYQGSKAGLRVSNGLMCEYEATLQEYLGQIPQARLVAQPPQDNKQNEIRRVFQKIEGCACAFIERAVAD